MSLVSTYVQAIDGKFYRNPVLREKDWFLCFDDDEPPELVVKDSLLKTKKPEEILDEIGIKYRPAYWDMGEDPWGKNHASGRHFGGKKPFHRGTGFFIEITARIPIPNQYDEVYNEKPTNQGVYYQWPSK